MSNFDAERLNIQLVKELKAENERLRILGNELCDCLESKRTTQSDRIALIKWDRQANEK